MSVRTVVVFRVLIVASFAAAVLGALVDVIVPNLLPKGLEDAYDAYVDRDLEWTSMLIAGAASLVVFVGAIAATVGLLLLRRWARRLALLMTVLAMPIYPLLGPTIYSGWASMLVESSMVMWGAALAMAYYSELAVYFTLSKAVTPRNGRSEPPGPALP